LRVGDQRCLVIVDRVTRHAVLEQQITDVGQRRGMPFIGCERVAERFERRLGAAQCDQRHPAFVEGCSVRRRSLQLHKRHARPLRGQRRNRARISVYRRPSA